MSRFRGLLRIVLVIGSIALGSGALLAVPEVQVAIGPSVVSGAHAHVYDRALNDAPPVLPRNPANRVGSTGRPTESTLPADGNSSSIPSVVAAEEGAVDASTPTGQRGSPMDVPRGTNSPAEIGGRSYGGHALDEMQSEGFMPSVVDDAIASGQQSVGASSRVAYYSPENNVTVIVENGRVVTVTSGTVKIR